MISTFVSLSASVSLKPDVQISPNFLRMVPVAVARSSHGNAAIRYVLPVWWMTSWLIGQTKATRIGLFTQRNSPGSSTNSIRPLIKRKYAFLHLHSAASDECIHSPPWWKKSRPGGVWWLRLPCFQFENYFLLRLAEKNVQNFFFENVSTASSILVINIFIKEAAVNKRN